MRMDRRRFFGSLGLTMAGMMGAARLARADRLRILGQSGGPQPAQGSGEPGPAGRSPELARTLAAVRVSGTARAGRLGVVWLQADSAGAAAPAPVHTLDEARAAGTLLIGERDQATVPELVVDNRGKAHVLLVAGEILLGGKQNRVLREDLLLPPLSGPRPIGVYCVEQGRWAGNAKAFQSGGTFAPPRLRSHLMEKAPQSQVWAMVDRYASRAAASSPTQSFQQVYEQPEVKAHLADVERDLDRQAPGGVLGAAVFSGEGLVGVDLFWEPGLFIRLWPKLLRAQALESYRGQDGRGAADEPGQQKRVEALLRTAARAEGRAHENAGVGRLFEFSAGDARGSALVWADRVVHLALV